MVVNSKISFSFLLTAILFILLHLPASIFAQNSCEVTIQIQNLENKEGYIRIAIFKSASGFPEDHQQAVEKISVKTKDLENGIQLRLPYGDYAFTMLHDENSDTKMNYNLIGIPKEGYGFSKLAKGVMRMPKFEETAILLNKPKQNVVLKVIYTL